jgi:hypothetical protein
MVKEMLKILLITTVLLLNFVQFSHQGPHGIKVRTTPNHRLSKNKKVFYLPNSSQSVSNFPEKTHRKLSRKKRFVTEALDGWIGIIALAGWRTSFSPDLIFYDFFKDKSKEEKKELEKFIKESRNELRKLQKQYENMQDKHIQLKNENQLNYDNLKSRHEKDLRIGLLGLNKNNRKKALRDVCSHVLKMGRKFCKLLQ